MFLFGFTLLVNNPRTYSNSRKALFLKKLFSPNRVGAQKQNKWFPSLPSRLHYTMKSDRTSLMAKDAIGIY
jgi:hypothetical protein